MSYRRICFLLDFFIDHQRTSVLIVAYLDWSLSMHIRRLYLEAANPHELADFYSDRFGLHISRDEEEITISVGATDLVFSESNADPFYHFAINVPENRFEAARDWLADQVGLLTDETTGDTEFFFEFMNAHATYFEDPAGNVGELIARHDLDNATDEAFGPAHLLAVSEIGLPVPDVPSVVEALETDAGVAAWEGDSETFRVLGDDHGLFIVVRAGRDWFVADRPAEIHPTEVVVADTETMSTEADITETETVYDVPNLPYRVTGLR
ncbi:VOC family protein [Haladaptatus sp. NG-SE-30]